MALRRSRPRPDDPPPFPEAVAQWRLSLRTQVKSASSLPTAIFHAGDATLEALLAESAEPMLARLHEPSPGAAQALPAGEQRIESVGIDELRGLPRRLREHGEASVDLDDHLTAEGIAVLTDACGSDVAPAATAARALLRQRFGIAPGEDPTATATRIAGIVQANADDEDAAAAVATLCQRIAAILAVQHPADDDA
jgi:hypothetical protein